VTYGDDGEDDESSDEEEPVHDPAIGTPVAGMKQATG